MNASAPRALAGYGAAIVGLHVAGWGLCLACAPAHPALPGLGLSAYLFGLRHGFDADHIAAVDDTARLLVQQGRRPLGIGFHFSAGHASVVFVLAALAALCASSVRQALPGLQGAGEVIGTLVSAGFLWVVGLLNLGALLRMLPTRGAQRRQQQHHHHHAVLEPALRTAGPGRLLRWLGAARTRGWARGWQMYLVGLLFGLGFDTASEIALLVLTGSAAAGHAPRLDVLALPLLFAAGMVLVDTLDGMLMTRAYAWAGQSPARSGAVNLAMTSLSAGIALLTGTVELLQWAARAFDAHAPVLRAASQLRLDQLGIGIVAACVLAWAVVRLLRAPAWALAGPAPRTPRAVRRSP